MRRMSLILALVLGTTLAFPLVARADYLTFQPDEHPHYISPGDIVYWSGAAVIRWSDEFSYIVFEGTGGFANHEFVDATIALSMRDIDGLGTVELLSSSTISGSTPDDWTTEGGPEGYFAVGPPIELRYTAPSAEELGCDDHPGEDFVTRVHVSGTLVGSEGTMASFSEESRYYIVDFYVTCPMATPTSRPGAPAAPAVTPPPTDTLPLGAASRSGWADWLPYLGLVAGAAAVVVLTRVSSSHRS
jgi:hypothetical protein